MGANLAAEYCVGCYHCVDSTVALNLGGALAMNGAFNSWLSSTSREL